MSNIKEADGRTTVVTGRVDDVRPYLARASVGCVPLLAGSGTRYKILESLSAGLPLVTTPVALEGLRLGAGQDLLVATSDEEIAGAVVRLLDDPVLAAGLARQGRATVDAQYAWSAILPRLDDWLMTLARLPRRCALAGERE